MILEPQIACTLCCFDVQTFCDPKTACTLCCSNVQTFLDTKIAHTLCCYNLQTLSDPKIACALCCSDARTFLDPRIACEVCCSDAWTFLDSSIACALCCYNFRVMSTLQNTLHFTYSPYIWLQSVFQKNWLQPVATGLWLVFLLQPFYHGLRPMNAQTTQDWHLQSGCNCYWSGLVSVFLLVVQPDFKSLGMRDGCKRTKQAWHRRTDQEWEDGMVTMWWWPWHIPLNLDVTWGWRLMAEMQQQMWNIEFASHKTKTYITLWPWKESQMT